MPLQSKCSAVQEETRTAVSQIAQCSLSVTGLGEPATVSKAEFSVEVPLWTLESIEIHTNAVRYRDGARERDDRLLNKTSWKHFHVSPCWLGWRKPKLYLGSTATKAPSNQQLLLRRSSSRMHNQSEKGISSNRSWFPMGWGQQTDTHTESLIT